MDRRADSNATREGNLKLVLVTGGSGYLACHIVQQLVQSGQFRVRTTVRSLSNEVKVKPLRDICPDSKQHNLELVEADLNNPESWDVAAEGCDYVIHVASPFPLNIVADEATLIKVAVEGTLNVLKAAHAAKTVKRVVLTSSVAAIMEVAGKKKLSEDDWSVVEKCTAYSKSKTLAEKAAWDFVRQLPDNDKIELAVINPGFIMGPTLTTADASSFEVVTRIMERDMPMLPKLHLHIVDVRDVALAHIRALTLPAAVGSRHICAPHAAWMRDLAIILSAEYTKKGYSIPTTQAPSFLMRLAALFNPMVKAILPLLDKEVELDSRRLQEVLLIQPRPLNETVIDMANSLIEKGIVKKSGQKTK